MPALVESFVQEVGKTGDAAGVVGDPDVVAVGFGYLHSKLPEVFAEAGEELCGGLVVGYDSDAADLLHGWEPTLPGNAASP